MEKDKRLNECIPDEIKEKIKKVGKENPLQPVYRVAKRGTINDIAFFNTYEETIYDKRKCKNGEKEIGTYSTSCYITQFYPLKFIAFLKTKLTKIYPCPKIMRGYLVYGLSQLTIDRIPDYEKDHIDWWICKDSFDQVKEEFKFVEQEGGADYE